MTFEHLCICDMHSSCICINRMNSNKTLILIDWEVSTKYFLYCYQKQNWFQPYWLCACYSRQWFFCQNKNSVIKCLKRKWNFHIILIPIKDKNENKNIQIKVSMHIKSGDSTNITPKFGTQNHSISWLSSRGNLFNISIILQQKIMFEKVIKPRSKMVMNTFERSISFAAFRKLK